MARIAHVASYTPETDEYILARVGAHERLDAGVHGEVRAERRGVPLVGCRCVRFRAGDLGAA